jgi:hypothetical protein
MFRWYRAAAICYAYLSDVNDLSNLEQSRWFTRGWTLQELLAPKDVLFYSSNWTLLGSKLKISDELSRITNVDTEILITGIFSHIGMAVRLSWAATRQTTRTEDMAYCLMGIVGVNMPLLYGEGKRSFIRLQEEILKTSDDYSIFAWGLPTNIQTGDEFLTSQNCGAKSKLHGLFADHPADFSLCHQINTVENWTTRISPTVARGAVEVSLPVIDINPYLAAALPFTLNGVYDCYVCIPLMEWKKGRFARSAELILVPETTHNLKNTAVAKWRTQHLDIAPPMLVSTQPQPAIRHFNISGIPNPSDSLEYTLEDVYCLPHAQYSAEDGEITLSEIKRGPHTVLFFTQISEYPTITELNSGNWKAWFKNKLLKVPDEYQVVQGNTKVINFKVNELNSRQPKFAIVLGTDATGSSSGVWVKFFHILDENTSDEDFHFLVRREAKLVQYCMTKSQMKSALVDQTVNESPLWDNGKTSECGWIECRKEYFTLVQNWTTGTRFLDLHTRWCSFEKVRDVFVDVSLQSQWRNLVEKRMVFSMKVYKKEDRWLLRRSWGERVRVIGTLVLKYERNSSSRGLNQYCSPQNL